MLIDRYELEVFTPPCEPVAERYAVMAHFAADISEALPYLNATLRGAVYHREAGVLTWKKGGHTVAFHAHELGASNVADRAAAEKEVKGLIALVNRTWEERDQVEPDYATHQRPTPMAVVKLLPQTNCRVCGEPTCFTFALKLVAGQHALDDCLPLSEPPYVAQLAQLQAMMPDAPAIG